jgi:hypothetical protein
MCSYNIFRTLNADEIDVRVQQVNEGGGKVKAILLLYKNARVDMDMLDEHFGCLGWQREHIFKDGKNYCKVSVYDRNNQRWVSKEDVGVESNTEETKGEASDAFKRACVNFGIGRELYTAPYINIELGTGEYSQAGVNKQNRPTYRTWVKFRVSCVGYDIESRSINDLIIVDGNGRVRYNLKEYHKATPPMGAVQGKPSPQPQPTKKTLTIDKIMDQAFLTTLVNWVHSHTQGKNIEDFIKSYYNVDAETLTCITNEYSRVYAQH